MLRPSAHLRASARRVARAMGASLAACASPSRADGVAVTDVEGDAIERADSRARAADDLAERPRNREVLHDIAKLDERCHVLGSNAALRRRSASPSRRQA